MLLVSEQQLQETMIMLSHRSASFLLPKLSVTHLQLLLFHSTLYLPVLHLSRYRPTTVIHDADVCREILVSQACSPCLKIPPFDPQQAVCRIRMDWRQRG